MSGTSRVSGAAIAAPETTSGPWISVVPYAEATGLLLEAYDWQAARLGAPTEFTTLGSLHPPLVLERLRLYKTVDEVPSALEPLERHLAAFVTSSLNQTVYCASGARLKVLAAGVEEVTVDALVAALDRVRVGGRADADGPLPDVELPPLPASAGRPGRLAALIRYAVVLVLRPGAVCEADIVALRAAGLGDLEILDLNDIVAYYCYINRVANGLGLRHPITDPAEAFHARPR